MLEYLKKMFSESDGSPSSMRLMSFEIVQVALFIAVFLALKCELTVEMIGMVIGLLGVGLTGKVTQKFAENKGQEVGPVEPAKE